MTDPCLPVFSLCCMQKKIVICMKRFDLRGQKYFKEMLELKPLHKESIPKALVRAKHYRLLNEPWQAASICKDILLVEPENQKAILYLILALTDQFGQKSSLESEAKELCTRLDSEYERLYYRGIMAERMGKVALKRNTPRASYMAYDYYEKAMELFEQASKISPEANDDAILRWNACLRAIKEFNITPAPQEDSTPHFLE